MKALRPAGNVGDLPSVVFGSRSLMWWATLGMMVIEGWTLALLVVAYLYFRQDFASWPPLRTPQPSLLVPTINLLLMFVSFVPAYLSARAAKQFDTPSVKRWLVVFSVIVVAIAVVRWWELWALNTRWDTNAYGSAAWTIVGLHTTLLVLDVADTIGLTLLFFIRELPGKVYTDTTDNSFYWYFTVGIWIPIYLIVYVGPRIF
jgi:heme/copper-type cytochrome/quinol oxidase subunit 3